MFARFSQPSLPQSTADALRTTLFSNLFDDVWYSRFPQVPSSTKERLVKGPFELTHMLDRERQTLVVRHNGTWLGSLLLLRRDNPRFLWTLPVTDQQHLDALVGALLQAAGIDASERAQTSSYA
jgi:hypothetical protein